LLGSPCHNRWTTAATRNMKPQIRYLRSSAFICGL
jgi:hypothetical protein